MHVVFTEQQSHGPHLNMGQMGIFLTFAQIMLLVAGSNCDATASVAIPRGCSDNNTQKKKQISSILLVLFSLQSKQGFTGNKLTVLLETEHSPAAGKKNTAALFVRSGCSDLIDESFFTVGIPELGKC